MSYVKRFEPVLSEHFGDASMREVDDGYFVTYEAYQAVLKEAELYRYLRDSAGNDILDRLKTKINSLDFDIEVITDKMEYDSELKRQSTMSTPF